MNKLLVINEISWFKSPLPHHDFLVSPGLNIDETAVSTSSPEF
jgi:hypothetical protein